MADLCHSPIRLHRPSATVLVSAIQSLHISDDSGVSIVGQEKPKKLEDELSQTHLVKFMRIFSVSIGGRE